MTYDALDNDIALLNVYFGESTAVGENETEGQHLIYSEYERTLKRTTIEIMVDMAAWFGELLNVQQKSTLIDFQVSFSG